MAAMNVVALKRIPLLVRGGVACGLVAGLAAGAMVGPADVGLLVGGTLGLAVGAAAGIVLEREDKRGAARHKELDAIIGVTAGDLGAPPGSIPPGPLDGDAPREWGDWLTPPPPQAV